jgi:ectoine hydroxylase
VEFSNTEIETFERDGYLFVPGLFTPAEVALLLAEAADVFTQTREEIIRERDGKTVRTAFGVQDYSEIYAALGRHPRLIEPAMRILGGTVYLHQFKINAKAAFDGDVWQWHQDYGAWAADDLMPEPHAMNIALYLDDVNEFNGPLMIIPGSHNKGRIEASHDTSTTSYPLWTIGNETIAELVAAGGIVAPKGAAGSVLFFHCNLVHGSAPNMSPWPRRAVYLSANRTDNAIRRFKRPDWIAHRDFTAIEPLTDDCLTA